MRIKTLLSSWILFSSTSLLHAATGPIITSSVDVKTGVTFQVPPTVVGTLTSAGTVIVTNSNTPCACATPQGATINGNLVLTTGSSFVDQFTPTTAGLTTVTGNISISPGSTIIMTPVPNVGIYQPGTVYEVIQTPGVLTGTFTTLTIPSPLFGGYLFYTNTDVFFVLDRVGLGPVNTPGNGGSVATALNTIVSLGITNIDSLIINLLSLTPSELTHALNQLQPSLYKGLAIVQENNVIRVHDALGYRFQTVLDEKECCVKHGKKRYHVWVHGLGDFADQKNTHFAKSHQVGYDSTTAGIVSGVDFSALENLYVGALGAYTHSNVNWRNDRGYGAVNSGYVGLYTSAIGRIFYGNAAVIRSWNQYDARRNIRYPGVHQSPHNKHSGNQVLTHLDTGANIRALKMTIRPFDSFDYITQQEQSYKEHGGGMTNLSVLGKTLRMIRNELGINFAKCVSFGRSVLNEESNPHSHHESMSTDSEANPHDAKKRRKPRACSQTKAHRLVFDFKLSWIREVRLKGENSVAQFSGTGVHFKTVGYFPDRSLFSPGLSIGYITQDDLLDVTAYYVAEINSTYSDQSVGLEVGFHF